MYLLVRNVSRIRSVAVKIALLALVVSLAFDVYYFVVIRAENEKAVNNMRSIALAVYGYEISNGAHFLEVLVNTGNYSWRDIARREFYKAWQQGELLLQGLPEDTHSFYTVLRDNAFFLDATFGFTSGPYNMTKIMTVVQLLQEINNAFFSLEIVRTADTGRDPLERMGESRVNSVIANCEQIHEILSG